MRTRLVALSTGVLRAQDVVAITKSLAEHLELAFDWPYREPPGQAWVCRTSGTFILTRAMERLRGGGPA